MRHLKRAAALAAVLASGAASAADITVPAPVPVAATPEFDVAFGASLASDYNFRGISQSDRGPSVRGYFELRYGIFYAGVAGMSVDLPNRPSGEFDLSAGFRPVFGPLTFDFGATYYYYPNESQLFFGGFAQTPRNTDFLEPYARVTWAVNDMFSVGANVFHAWDWLGTGANATYASGTLAINLPNNFQISGEVGRYFLGTQTDPGIVPLVDYTYWNAGISYTFNNVVKLDLRYHGTDLSREECFINTTDPGGLTTGRSRWCGDAVVGTISFDTTFSAIRPAAR